MFSNFLVRCQFEVLSAPLINYLRWEIQNRKISSLMTCLINFRWYVNKITCIIFYNWNYILKLESTIKMGDLIIFLRIKLEAVKTSTYHKLSRKKCQDTILFFLICSTLWQKKVKFQKSGLGKGRGRSLEPFS